MPTLQVGKTHIPYTVRHSSRAKHLQMVVTSDLVEVVAPVETTPDQITHFLDDKRRWLFNAITECNIAKQVAQPDRYVSGAKLLYRGRRLMLQIEAADVEQVTITCKSRFYVQVPLRLTGEERESEIAVAFETWLRDRAFQDAQRLTQSYARKLGVTPRAVKVSDQKYSWATCGKDGVVRINWHLVEAPLAAMEYVVAHEVTHLLHRNHSDTFWTTLGSIMPDWRDRKKLLESWERQH